MFKYTWEKLDSLENEVSGEKNAILLFRLIFACRITWYRKSWNSLYMHQRVRGICTRKREVERVGRLGSGSHARHARGERGNREEYFYCSSSCLRVAFPGHWADPLKTWGRYPCLDEPLTLVHRLFLSWSILDLSCDFLIGDTFFLFFFFFFLEDF